MPTNNPIHPYYYYLDQALIAHASLTPYPVTKFTNRKLDFFKNQFGSCEINFFSQPIGYNLHREPFLFSVEYSKYIEYIGYEPRTLRYFKNYNRAKEYFETAKAFLTCHFIHKSPKKSMPAEIKIPSLSLIKAPELNKADLHSDRLAMDKIESTISVIIGPDNLALFPVYVSVCAQGELFWIQLTGRLSINDEFVGVINNDLNGTLTHGLSCGEWIKIKLENIIQIL